MKEASLRRQNTLSIVLHEPIEWLEKTSLELPNVNAKLWKIVPALQIRNYSGARKE
jgi:hypothetical protein